MNALSRNEIIKSLGFESSKNTECEIKTIFDSQKFKMTKVIESVYEDKTDTWKYHNISYLLESPSTRIIMKYSWEELKDNQRVCFEKGGSYMSTETFFDRGGNYTEDGYIIIDNDDSLMWKFSLNSALSGWGKFSSVHPYGKTEMLVPLGLVTEMMNEYAFISLPNPHTTSKAI
jgi:hypothetical protein